MNSTLNLTLDKAQIVKQLKEWALELGFSELSIVRLPPSDESVARMHAWLEDDMHGEMAYLKTNMSLRADPRLLVPEAKTAIMVRMNYLSVTGESWKHTHAIALNDGKTAVIAAYALGRDYHKVLKKRLAMLAQRLSELIVPLNYRVFTDSAPIMEVELAQSSGLGWRGKHSLLLSREGSWFFIGEILTDVELPPSEPVLSHCGSCTSCIKACPTQAIVEPYRVDARRCVSYLTIELKGAIPHELRPLIGTRVYGCDDCQTACPWNKFAQPATETDFLPRKALSAQTVLSLWGWSPAMFDQHTQGSAIRRIGYESWRRNLAVAMGNLPYDPVLVELLDHARTHESSVLVQEHLQWAYERQLAKQPSLE